MEIYYEDDYSECQQMCIVCDNRNFLLNANFNGFHKVCTKCRHHEKLNEVLECRQCSSKVKVLKYIKDDEENKQNSEKKYYESVDTRRKAEENKALYFKCLHTYCMECHKKYTECIFCRTKQKSNCPICNKVVNLEKKGDYWFCPYCQFYSIECIACSKQNFALLKGQKCEICECESKPCEFPCGHRFCEAHKKPTCEVCENKWLYRCKYCKTFDSLCKNSICPYCSNKSSKKFCLLCKLPLSNSGS